MTLHSQVTRRAFSVLEYLLYVISVKEQSVPKHLLLFSSSQIYFSTLSRLVLIFLIKPNAFFNDSENHIKSSLRTRLVWELSQRSKTSVKTMSNALRLFFKQFFQIARKLKHISKTNVILTLFVLKKSPREIQFFLSHVCGETDAPHGRCRTSAVVLTKNNRILFCINLSTTKCAP